MNAHQAAPSAGAAASRQLVCPHCGAVNRVAAAGPVARALCGACKGRMFEGRAIPVDEAHFEKYLHRDNTPLLVDMWAPWCGPCRAMAPLFERAAGQLEPQLRLLKLNVDEAQQTAARLAIRGIPALCLFRDGKLLAQSSGVQSTETIIHWAQAQLSAPSGATGV